MWLDFTEPQRMWHSMWSGVKEYIHSEQNKIKVHLPVNVIPAIF